MRHSESSVVFVSAKNWHALMDALPTLKSQIHTVIFWGTGPIDEQVGLLLLCRAGRTYLPVFTRRLFAAALAHSLLSEWQEHTIQS